jgi:hypothetical protein
MLPILASWILAAAPATQVQPLDGLAVSVSVERIEWSQPIEDPIHLLRVWIRVRIENRSSERYILPRLVAPPRGGRVKVQSEPQRSYEFWGSEIHGPSRTAKFGPQPDSERFVLLAPGEAFETMTTTGVQVDFSSGSIPKTVKPGDDVLLEVPIEIAPARPISDEAVRALTEGWRRVGKLIAGTVWSGPLHVQVPARR